MQANRIPHNLRCRHQSVYLLENHKDQKNHQRISPNLRKEIPGVDQDLHFNRLTGRGDRYFIDRLFDQLAGFHQLDLGHFSHLRGRITDDVGRFRGSEMSNRNQDRRNHHQHVSDIRNQSKNSEEDPDQESIGKTDKRKRHRHEGTVDQTHHHLPAEKGDQIPVHLFERAHDLVFKIGSPQRQIIAPGFGNGMPLPQEVVQIDWNQQ